LRIATRGLGFAAPVEEAGSQRDALPLELAAALIEDEQNRIDVEAPFVASSSTRGIGGAVADALRGRVIELSADPFAVIGDLVARDGDSLRTVRFEAGDAGLGATARETIDGLAEAMRRRPRLGLQVLGGFDAAIDRDALARQQIELHVLLATAGPTLEARPEPVDFASARAQDVLDEFAGERLTADRMAEISARFRCSGTIDALCRTAYYAAVFDALVGNEPIANATLNRLGRFRAQSVANALVEFGIPAERVEVGAGEAVVTRREIGLPLRVLALF
jgi:outer membrane protein OmpA-like peptidoglycan-associated protein